VSRRTRAVLFDFYGTLAPGRSVAAQTAARTAQAEALGVDPDAFDDELTATVDERFRGAGGDVEGSLRWLAHRLGADPTPAQVRRAAQVRLAGERSFGDPRPDAVEVLRGLHDRGLRIGVVSDCSAELPVYFATLPIASHVDAVVLSFVTGHRKPEPENYLACCAELGVEPADGLYVGDGGSDELAGARRVGLRAVHLAVPGEQDSLVYGRHLDWDGEVITSLADVAQLV
jgi:putative hydrolase of the HAD superfamily